MYACGRYAGLRDEELVEVDVTPLERSPHARGAMPRP
jgi:hypothetical protein